MTLPEKPASTRSTLGVKAIVPYLFFGGRAQEAIAFYGKALGAETTTLMRFKDNPQACDQSVPANLAENIMHASLSVGGNEIFVSDGCCAAPEKFQSFSVSLTFDTPANAKRVFAALSDGGEVKMPLEATFFSPSFGIVADRFGVSWMIYVLPANS